MPKVGLSKKLNEVSDKTTVIVDRETVGLLEIVMQIMSEEIGGIKLSRPMVVSRLCKWYIRQHDIDFDEELAKLGYYDEVAIAGGK